MSIFIVHDFLKAKFETFNEPLTVCMPDGHVIGYFTPNKEANLNFEPPELPPGELDRREASGVGRSLKDILRNLETR